MGAILIILIASAFGAAVTSLLGTDAGGSLHYGRSLQALFIAEGGLEYYLERLQGQAGSWIVPPAQPANMALGIGTFTITTSNVQANSMTVTSTATASGMDNISVTRAVSATATRVTGAPAAFSYVMRGNSPGGINFTGSAGAVTGNLSSAGNISGIPAAGLTLSGTAYPNTALTFPAPDFPSYQAAANQVVSGNFTFAANTTYNGIYYVTGNVTFQNGAKLYGTLVMPSSNRTITLSNTSGVIIDPSLDPLHPGGSYPAIVSAGSILAQTTTNLAIKRLVYTDKNANPSINFRYSSGLNFTGSIVSQGGVDIRNNTGLSMVFDSGILTSPPPYFSGGGGQTVSDTLWDEVY